MAVIGITTTVPQEVIWASGNIPVDLNNVFVASPLRESFLSRANRDGYPRTVCPWIAGIYGAVVETKSIDALVVVTQGDCSNTHALAETLEDAGIDIIPFAYPYDGDQTLLRAEIEHFSEKLGATMDDILKWFYRLRKPRKLVSRMDEMTWRENLVTGRENHRWLVASSDFDGDIEAYSRELSKFIDTATTRQPRENCLRLGYIGVPPIFPDIYDEVETFGARVVFNETQRQFSLPFPDDGFIEAYAKYTYPASVFRRIEDIRREIARRELHGIIHYTQSFCFRQIEDLLFRRHLDVPVLTLEGENSFEIDERTRVRLEAFIRMLEERL